MIPSHRISSRRVTLLLALMFAAAAVQPGFAAEPADRVAAGTTRMPSVTSALIKRLAARGLLTKEDAAELQLMAEAEAAEARAQDAMLQAALAQAAAAQARLKAMMAMADAPRMNDAAADAAEAVEPQLAPRVAHAPVRPRAAHVQPAPAPVEETPAEEAKTEEMAPEPAPRVAQARAKPRPASAPAPVEANPPEAAPSEDDKVPEDTVRVTYVPETVKAQLREEIKQDVMAQARDENWANPRTFPEWVGKFRLFGDTRFRYEGIHYPAGNDNTGAFPNFNAINTGAPFDTSGVLFSPQLNVDQNRDRLRLRARVGAEVDLGENFSTGLRLATGENNSPVTQNQSLGAAGSGQGGDFSKYAVWLDRGFLKYEFGGQPDNDYTFNFGRFDNPFFSTPMIWADDIGFDGLAARGRFSLGEDVTPFFTVGAFPVFNTDLNFASNKPAKYKSNDKWLYGSQLGTTWELGKDLSLKIGAAYYLFQNIEGKLSSPFTPTSSADVGDTDSSRPAFAQKGNTYMPLRDITPGPLNGNGTTNQWQYFGLASKFHELALDARLDFNHFEPFQISLMGEYVRNGAFDQAAIARVAINNLGPDVTNTTTNTKTSGPFLGGNTAWLVGLSVGDAALKKRWDWNLNLNYRKVSSDAVVDSFNDSDFGGGGTNVKGLTFGGNVALSSSVSLGLHWFSATQVAGPTFKNDILQLDFSGKF